MKISDKQVLDPNERLCCKVFSPTSTNKRAFNEDYNTAQIANNTLALMIFILLINKVFINFILSWSKSVVMLSLFPRLQAFAIYHP